MSWVPGGLGAWGVWGVWMTDRGNDRYHNNDQYHSNDSNHSNDRGKLMNEQTVSDLIRLEASHLGIYLWRNNIGVMFCPRTGRTVRYGLANDSSGVNALLKSSDLIGIMPDGRFVAIEVKAEGWKGPPHGPPDGPNGLYGPNGPNGPNGLYGVNGPNGSTGPNGLYGPPPYGQSHGQPHGPTGERELGQQRFIELIKRQHGVAGFAASVLDFRRIVG